MTRILPPDISTATFDRALAAFEAIVGATQVASSPASLAPYADPFAPGSLAASFVPSAAQLPASVD